MMNGVDTVAIAMIAQAAATGWADRPRWMQYLGGWKFPAKTFFVLGIGVLVLDAALQLVAIHFVHESGHAAKQFVGIFVRH